MTARVARRAAGVLLVAGVALGAGAPDAPAPPDTTRAVAGAPATPDRPAPRRSITVYVDLLDRARRQVVLAGARAEALTWSHGDDARPVLFQHPPSRVELGPLPAGQNCRLRFALGLTEAGAARSDGVRFRVELRRPGADPTTVFDELLAPGAIREPAWHEREIALPERADVDTVIVFETDPGPSGSRDFDRAGWAAPGVTCTDSQAPAPRPDRPHVILISIDTLRADHLGVYGYEPSTSPVLDALAAESLVFEQAFAPAPWTLPSHASLFTGLLPHQHGAGHPGHLDPLGEGPATLGEWLAAAGYRTVAFTGGGLMHGRWGIDRGFATFGAWPSVRFDRLLPAIYAAIGTQPQRPLFLFLHSYDVHGPYLRGDALAAAPSPAGTPAAARGSGDTSAADAEWRRIRSIPYHDYLRLERFAGLDEVVAAYDAGIRRIDAELGRLFERLREVGIYEDALIIVTSDHGESLYDRGLYIGHSYTLHDEALRVPLIVRLPRAARRGRRPELASLVDVAPLVLDALGLPVPAGLSGASPLARIDGRAPARVVVRGEASHSGARFVRSADWKWIAAAHPIGAPESAVPPAFGDRIDLSWQLFDLVRDPHERRSLSSGAAKADARAARALLGILRGMPRPGRAAADVELEDDAAEQLRALGYLE